MDMCTKKRAISEVEKLQKAEKIIDAAEFLWGKTDFDKFTMQSLALEMDIAKGTLYLYYKTKEDVFLALYKRLLSVWFNDVEILLTTQQNWTASNMAKALTSSLENSNALIRLIAILGTVLEKNISYNEAVHFKKWLVSMMEKTSYLLEQTMSELQKGQGYTILIFLQASAAGLYSMSFSSPLLQEILKKEEFALLHIDFSKTLRKGMEIFITGLINSDKIVAP